MKLLPPQRSRFGQLRPAGELIERNPLMALLFLVA